MVLAPFPAAQLAALSADNSAGLLGLACVGTAAVPRIAGLPLQHIAAPLLGASPDHAGPLFCDAWRSALTCIAWEGQGIRFRADSNLLYGIVEVDENNFAAEGGASPLQRATEDAYRRLFRLLDAEGFPQLWRVWNYFPGINAESPEYGGLERYRQFNVGRQDAFLASGRLTGGAVPAACALGVRQGPLSIAFMAGRELAVPLENPRQVSAWDYPQDYGPRSPTFARGALVRLPAQELLFISGTASIVGHQTVHPGDVAGQTRESLANIAAVLGEANRAGDGEAYTLAGLDYRVYIRRAEDFATVRGELQPLLGERATAVYVQADICRADLLVEIEAVASRAAAAAE
ncbi:MAG: hypothetical protein HYU78_08515 [Rhodocyclales bacterium]|nr:hypothetical protein [Rhodocyclales bacterium]